jgi:hypothetical protein
LPSVRQVALLVLDLVDTWHTIVADTYHRSNN